MSNLIREPRTDKRGITVHRWVKEAASSPSPALAAAPPTLAPVNDSAASMGTEIIDAYEFLKISDGMELRTLREFSDPKIASGSCWRVTNELIESVDFSEYGYWSQPDWANAVGSATKDGINIEHYAAFFESEQMVLDYTIRQFDENLPFPLVTSFDEWSRLMRVHLGPNVDLSTGELDYDDYDDEDEDDGDY
jgi:hypothetical protein